jgi:peroxiredoxin
METGERAPGFALAPTDGETVTLEGYRGGVRVVLFFMREFT